MGMRVSQNPVAAGSLRGLSDNFVTENTVKKRTKHQRAILAHGAWRMAHGAWRMAHGADVFGLAFSEATNMGAILGSSTLKLPPLGFLNCTASNIDRDGGIVKIISFFS